MLLKVQVVLFKYELPLGSTHFQATFEGPMTHYLYGSDTPVGEGLPHQLRDH